MTTFESLGLSQPLLKTLLEEGYSQPTPIQQKAIPAILKGHDVMAAAQTGTGKTAAFALPLLETLLNGRRPASNQIRALILTPTRELACQVWKSVDTYSQNLPLSSTVVYGGVKINPQMMALRKGIDVLVATPGRLIDLYGKNAIKFDHLETVILDEADRMLDMGFIEEIQEILSFLPKNRKNLMFSATFSEEVRKFAKGLVKNPIEISVSPRNTTAKTVKQWLCPVDKKRKPELLTKLITDGQWSRVLVFTRTRNGADLLTKTLVNQNIKATAIHSNKPQGSRTKSLSRFKEGSIQVLVATDIAARGLDIDHLPHVVNFDLPNIAEDYIHRIGRTGRAGSTGEAISLVSADEFRQLTAIERLTNKIIDREYVDGFDPIHAVPESNLNKPKKIKKPKKSKESKIPGLDSVADYSGSDESDRPRKKIKTKSLRNEDGTRKRPPGRRKKSRRPGLSAKSSNPQESNKSATSGGRSRKSPASSSRSKKKTSRR